MDEIEKKTGPPVDAKSIKIGAPENSTPEDTPGSDPPEKGAEGKNIVPTKKDPPKDFFLDDAEPLPPDKFPNQRTGGNGGNLPTTIPNVRYMLSEY